MKEIEYKCPTEFPEGQTIVTQCGVKYIVWEKVYKMVKRSKKLTRKIPAPTFENPDRMIEKEVKVPVMEKVYTKVVLKGVRLGMLMELEPYRNKHYKLFVADVVDPAPMVGIFGTTI